VSLSLCLASPVLAVGMALAPFTLQWTHSVERVVWQERWAAQADGLRLVEAQVRGSGAGMEPADGARWQDGAWVWGGDEQALAALDLAVSGATGQGWQWCTQGRPCVDLETWLGLTPERIRALPGARIRVQVATGCRPLMDR
jgi:hypothetical protein